VLIEEECKLLAVPRVHLTHKGFGRALISVGKLLAVDRTLRDVHRFGFPSLSKMKDEADKILALALERIGQYPALAGLQEEGGQMGSDDIVVLEKEARRLQRIAAEWAARLHELAEERLPAAHSELPPLSQFTFDACKAWAEASTRLAAAQQKGPAA